MCTCTWCHRAGGATFETMDYWERVNDNAWHVYQALRQRDRASITDDTIRTELYGIGYKRLEQHHIDAVWQLLTSD